MLKYFVLILFLSSCAGFYTKSDQSLRIREIKAKQLNVFFDMSFNIDDRLVDEIEINSKALFENKINTLKDKVMLLLKTSNPNKTFNIVLESSPVKDQCLLKIKFNEKSNSVHTRLSAMTLFIWPYVQKREVTFKSELMKADKLLSESLSVRHYKAVFALFVLPLAPFKIVQEVEQDAWEDSLKESFSNLDFSKCE